MREEKIELQRLHQEERVKRALERAKAEPKKKVHKGIFIRHELGFHVPFPQLIITINPLLFSFWQTGKKLVFRSEPPQLKKKEDEGADQASREEEELAYYFQW